jgi:hypothetical protein
VAALGVIAYAVQIALGRLSAPWYMPVAGTIGVVLAVISFVQRRSVWRALGLAALLLLAAAEWGMVYGLRLPPYNGPVVVGRPFPAFETLRADGTPFKQTDLAGDRNNVLVFFRGRW